MNVHGKERLNARNVDQQTNHELVASCCVGPYDWRRNVHEQSRRRVVRDSYLFNKWISSYMHVDRFVQ